MPLLKHRWEEASLDRNSPQYGMARCTDCGVVLRTGGLFEPYDAEQIQKEACPSRVTTPVYAEDPVDYLANTGPSYWYYHPDEDPWMR